MQNPNYLSFDQNFNPYHKNEILGNFKMHVFPNSCTLNVCVSDTLYHGKIFELHYHGNSMKKIFSTLGDSVENTNRS